MDSLRARIEETERRFQKRKRARGTRRSNLERLSNGGDWRKVDEPARVMRRLVDLGLADVAGDAVAAPTDGAPIVLERIINGNQLVGVDFFIRGAMAARSVGRVVVRTAGGAIAGFGTGSLVTPRLLMTNNHVLDSPAAAFPSTIQFDFVEQRGRVIPVQEYNLRPDLFFSTDARLDFTLVAVNPVSTSGTGLDRRPWNPLFADSGKVVVGERINLIQHPAGRPQELSIRDNKVVDVFEEFLHYSSDTEQGSSGSPAFNDQWVLAALHHSGVPDRNDDGQILLTSGEPWDGSEDTVPSIAWLANEGIRISSIVAHLRDRADTITGQPRELLDELFAAERPEPDPNEDGRPDDNGQLGTVAGPGDLRGELDESGRVHWILPLEITANIGTAGGSPVLAPSGGGTGTSDDGGDDLAALALDAAALAKALARLAEANDRDYLDEERDAADRAAYYADLEDEPSGAELFDRLSDLATTTHHTKLSYKTARLEFLYPVVDLRPPPDLNLASVYSGIGFPAEEVIREELAAEARRDEMLRRFTASEAYAGEGSLLEFLEQLETVAPFNCEHVVPQSWFDKRNPMKSDLHHLFTCEPGCNSFRSNIPYFQFSPEDEVVRSDCGRREETRFEPHAGKGAAARATLYFLIRYPGLIGDEGRELGDDRLGVLLQWHAEHPPDDWERHRNAEIFRAQGNRNPFIDRPDWATRTEFARGFGDR